MPSGLDGSAAALTRTVDALSEEELAAPSLLPGWTRAHVVAHLALNGYALVGVLEAVRRGGEVAMYESGDQRDRDIEELAAGPTAELRERFLAATTLFADAVAETDDWSGTYSRTPGTEQLPLTQVVPMRRRELEIHHADLGVVYAAQDWPVDFVADLLEAVHPDHADDGPFVVRATDLGREWPVGTGGGPVVSGSGAALGWWLTGRGSGEGLTCESGDLPRLGPWRRASVTAAPTPER